MLWSWAYLSPRAACKTYPAASSAPSRFFWPINSRQVLPVDVLGAEIRRALGLAEIMDLSQVVMRS